MKNTQLTTREDRTERGFFALVSFGILLLIMLFCAIAESCTTL